MPLDQNALSWTSAQVLSDVRRKASLPATSTDYTDAVILREATDAIWSFAGWALALGAEGRLLQTMLQPASSVLASDYGTLREFNLPALAVADTIDSVTFRDSSNNEWPLALIDQAEQGSYDTPTTTGTPSGYALLGERIRIYPGGVANAGGTFRVNYRRRHPELVADTALIQTTSTISSNGGTLSNVVLTQPYTFAVGDELDIFAPSYPYRLQVAGARVTQLVPTNTVAIDVPFSYFGSTVAGLRVAKAGTSPFVALPLEFRQALNNKIVSALLRDAGDLQGMNAAEAAAKDELSRVMQLLSPRVKRDRPKAVNPFSLLRAGLARFRR